MRQYLTISEFAALRSVNINSIRYYEKLGILMPAWVDPQTKYRYYRPEQVNLLDTIILCTVLGVSLKNLNQYMDQNGILDSQRIFEDGQLLMREKVQRMEELLELSQHNLTSLQENRKYGGQSGMYQREIGERYLLEIPYQGDWDNLIKKEETAQELFHTAQEKHLVPVFPAGIVVRINGGAVSYSFFVQVLWPQNAHIQTVHIPKHTFSCMQANLKPQTDILQLLTENFPASDLHSVVISNMLLDKLHLNSRYSEIQTSTLSF